MLQLTTCSFFYFVLMAWRGIRGDAMKPINLLGHYFSKIILKTLRWTKLIS